MEVLGWVREVAVLGGMGALDLKIWHEACGGFIEGVTDGWLRIGWFWLVGVGVGAAEASLKWLFLTGA